MSNSPLYTQILATWDVTSATTQISLHQQLPYIHITTDYSAHHFLEHNQFLVVQVLQPRIKRQLKIQWLIINQSPLEEYLMKFDPQYSKCLSQMNSKAGLVWRNETHCSLLRMLSAKCKVSSARDHLSAAP